MIGLCVKCKMRLCKRPFKSYKESVCWICYLKSQKKYRIAMNEIGGWFDWRTYIKKTPRGISVKTGWSIVDRMWTILMFTAVCNCNSLNKSPKMPESIGKTDREILKKAGYSDWAISIYCSYFGR